MPKKIHGKPVDEDKWSKAKAQAAKEGHAEDYAYIMGIYKKMAGMKKSKKILVIKLEKGRKGVADGTVMDVKGTPYKRMKQGGKWIHVKVNKQGVITNMAGQVVGQTNAQGNNSQAQGQQAQAPRGRGRPRKDAAQQQAQKQLAQMNSAGASTTHAKRRGRPSGYRKVNGVFVHPDKLKAEEEAKKQAALDAQKKADEEAAQKKADEEAKKKPVRAKKADKKDDAKKRDTYQAGDKVMRKNSAGNYYWSQKNADGTWSYLGLATKAEVKSYIEVQKKKKRIEKERALNEKKRAELKAGNSVAASDDDEWNSDGTPKQAALDKMTTKEKMYWTTATERARKLADKCGVLCLDKESEDYVEAKLDNVFKTTAAEAATLEAVKADVPLDIDGKFADDPVFMEDTLNSMVAYLEDLETNKKQHIQIIEDRLDAEFSYIDTNAYRNTSQKDELGADYPLYLVNKTKESYDETVNAVSNIINEIKQADKNKLHMEKLRELDEGFRGLRQFTSVPLALVDHTFGEVVDKYYADNASDADKKPLQDIFESLGFSRDDIFSLSMDTPHVSETLMMALNPHCTKDNCRRLFEVDPTNVQQHYDYDSGKSVDNHAYYNSSSAVVGHNAYGARVNRLVGRNPGDAGYISAETFFENAEKLREKYKAVSTALGKLTTLEADHNAVGHELGLAGKGYYAEGPRILNGLIIMQNSSVASGDPDMKWEDVKNVLAPVMKQKSHSDFAADILKNVVTAADMLGKDVSLDRGPDRAGHMFELETIGITKQQKEQVLVPTADDIYKRMPMNMNFKYNSFDNRNAKFMYMEVNSDYHNEKIDKIRAGTTKKMRTTARNVRYNRHSTDVGLIHYGTWKRDSRNGGGVDSTRVPEVFGENIAMKNAIRAKWNKMFAINTAASRTHASQSGVDNHAKASLAVAIGLNWQLRKLVKKQKLIPDWKWYPGTKPYSADNMMTATYAPVINNPTVTRGGGGRRRGVSKTTYNNQNAGAKFKFTEADYKHLLNDAKEQTMAVELGLIEAKPIGSHPSPKIVLRNSVKPVAQWQAEINADWTHKGGLATANNMKVRAAFDVMYHDYFPKYKEIEKTQGNVGLMYHGTSFVNGAKIIKDGYKIGLPRKSGGDMLGSQNDPGYGRVSTGNYFAESSSKAAQYASGQGFSAASSGFAGGGGVMFVARVARGKMNDPANGSLEVDKAIHDRSYNTIYAMKGYSGLRADEYKVRDPASIVPIHWLDFGEAK